LAVSVVWWILLILGNTVPCYRVYKSPFLVHIMRQISPSPSFSSFYKTHLILYSYLNLGFPSCLLPSLCMAR
jgi:hypothetical protein